jgi:chemotaxis regulatin CheY-phosphate phosphatase CheZ
MPDSPVHEPVVPGPDRADPGGFVTIPVRARDEIGELAFYLEQVRRNLLTVNAHLLGSSRTMPSVLHDLKDIVQMTEHATVRVLEEAESLLDEGKALSDLIGDAERAAAAHALSDVSRPLTASQTLVERGHHRLLAIMSALEFQDLTSQKIQRAFEVLEEVATRLNQIRNLVSLGEDHPSPPAEPHRTEPVHPDGQSGQALADELLRHFSG